MKKHTKVIDVENSIKECAAKNEGILVSSHACKRMWERGIDKEELLGSLETAQIINVEKRDNINFKKETRYTLRCYLGDKKVDVILGKNKWATNDHFVLITTYVENTESDVVTGKPSPAKPYRWAKKKQAMKACESYRVDDFEEEYKLACELSRYD